MSIIQYVLNLILIFISFLSMFLSSSEFWMSLQHICEQLDIVETETKAEAFCNFSPPKVCSVVLL